MKGDIDNVQDIYRQCKSMGMLKEKAVDTELIRSLATVAEKGHAFIKGTSKQIPKESTDWTFVFRDYYEALRGFIEAYLLFDGIEADSHQCKNAYLCVKHPELELDWTFLETVRLKRNAINYRGLLLTYADWNRMKLPFELHISLLKRKIGERLEEQ